MRILAIDTALEACSMAVVQDEHTLVSHIELVERGHAERLAVMVEDVLANHDIALNTIDRIAVTRGPGAFTGLRIGLAFARGLALALDRPCIGVSTLEVLAASAQNTSLAAAPPVLAAIAQAGSLFVGAWEGKVEHLAPIQLLSKIVLESLPDRAWCITGPGAATLHTALPLLIQARSVIFEQSLPDPVVLARLARSLEPNQAPPVPLYLRGSDAKLPEPHKLPDPCKLRGAKLRDVASSKGD